MILEAGIINTVDFEPQTLVQEIEQNLRILLSTYIFSVPLDRRLGITADYVDDPLDDSIDGQIQSDIIDTIKRYEPRVNIKSVSYSHDANNNRVIPTIDYEIIGGTNE